MKKRTKIIVFLIILFLLAIIGFFISTLRIGVVYTDKDGKPINENELGKFRVTFTGSIRYTESDLENFFFESDMDKNPVAFLFKHKFGSEIEIPFIETYDMEMISLTEYKITIYEKSVVGYINYMGSNMYFDKDGIVVESSTKTLEDVPFISGISFDYIVLHSKLPVEDEKVFTVLLDVTQLVEKYDMSTEKIHISPDLQIVIYVGNVKVELGTKDNLNEKMQDLSDIIPEFGDVSGTLNMKEYNFAHTGYTLKRDDMGTN